MRRMLHRLFLRLRPIGAIQLYRVERWYAGYHPVGRSRLSRARRGGETPHGGRGLGARGVRGSAPHTNATPIGLIKPLSRTFWQSFLRKRGTCLRLHS